LLYILLGQDDFSLRQSLEEIKKGAGDQALLATNTVILEGQKVTSDQLKNICETVPFLAEKRLVIIEGLLERFESKGKPSQKKKAGRVASQQDEYKSLSACLSKIPESTVVVLIDGKIKTSNPLFKELSAKAEVRSFPLLSESRLRQWIQQRVAARGGAISSQAVDLLVKLVGPNLWVMSSEIDKLSLFASGRRIDEEDVKAVVSSAQEASVFTMIDAILELKMGAAEQLLQQLLQRGAAPTYLLAMLSRQLQMIVQAKELKNQRKPKAEIQSRLGLVAEFALRKTLEQAERYSWERIKHVYSKLLEADLAIKTGKYGDEKYGDELALNVLVAELCQ